MPKEDHTQLVCIIDRSGSMASIAGDAIGGFNTFLEEQKKQPGTTKVSLVLFDHEYMMPVKNEDILNVKPLDDKVYVPRGSTALLDAVGRTINETGAELSSLHEEERPDNVIICILTDGYENASKEFKRDQIKKMIEHQKEKYSWDFIFLAANQDAFAEGGSIGIDIQDSYNFVSDSKGTTEAFKLMSDIVIVKKRKKK